MSLSIDRLLDEDELREPLAAPTLRASSAKVPVRTAFGPGLCQASKRRFMVARPSHLAEWNLPLIREIASSGIPENDWFDLKGNIQGLAERQRKAVAAFANTQGGFLVFGVTNNREVLGVDNPELPRDFNNKFTHGLYPTVAFEFSGPMRDERMPGSVWVCEVPRSPRGPHAVLSNDQWYFPRRTESGNNVTMNVEEIRAAFEDSGQKRANLEFFRSELHRISELAERHGQSAYWNTRDFTGVRYNIARFEGVLPLIFNVLSRNSWLVRHVDAMRNAAEEADAWLSAVSPFILLDGGQYAQLQKKVMDDAVRVRNAAGSALAVLDKVLS